VELTGQVPYLPWARVRAKRFVWEAEAAPKDVKGWAYGFGMDVHQNLQIEYSAIDANNQSRVEHGVFLRFRYNFSDRPVALSSRFIDSEPWNMRDMKNHTLDRVRRENKIILENTVVGAVTIGRGT